MINPVTARGIWTVPYKSYDYTRHGNVRVNMHQLAAYDKFGSTVEICIDGEEKADFKVYRLWWMNLRHGD